MAQRLAPVQATYLGYHGTTGLKAMDYRISDPHVDSVGLSEGYYIESLARLPNCLWCYRPPQPSALSQPRATDIGITFASLNNLRKIAAPMLSMWARVLRALPQARLVIAGAGATRAARGMHAQLAKDGIDASRVELVDWLQPRAFAALHGRIDIALDTYPFNGGATTISALYNGVPVVSMAGRCAASRCGLTILANAGIPELAARDGDEFVGVACALANDPARLHSLKRELPGIMQRSPMMNEAQFVADFEQLCRGLWRRWCSSAPR
jgi:predicted O-linked N-acetylglucosamine transferase (SPINDLY family)